jgi:sensor histidine kinase regulating citrate/malate metabolism
MKLKHRILSCLTLLAVVWGIVFSGTIFFQQQEEVNFKKLAHSNLTQNHNNSIDNNLLLINLLSNKTEENRELTEYENEANEEDFLYIILTNLHTDFSLFNLYFHYSLTEISLIPKYSLIVKYCSLKLPF